METKETVERKQVRKPRTGRKRRRYRFEEKLKAVRLHLQEGFSRDLVCEETGVAPTTLTTWVQAYRAHGEAGLQGQTAPRPGRRLPAAITEKILQLKRANRWYGVKKIAHALQRLFMLPGSPETVLEFRGYVMEEGAYLLNFTLTPPQGRPQSQWLAIGESSNELQLRTFDQTAEVVEVEYRGKLANLKLKKSRIQLVAAPHVPAPSSAPLNPANPPDQNISVERERMENAVEEIRRRRAL